LEIFSDPSWADYHFLTQSRANDTLLVSHLPPLQLRPGPIWALQFFLHHPQGFGLFGLIPLPAGGAASLVNTSTLFNSNQKSLRSPISSRA